MRLRRRASSQTSSSRRSGPLEITPWWLPRLLGVGRHRLAVGADEIGWIDHKSAERSHRTLEQILSVEARRSLFGRNVVLTLDREGEAAKWSWRRKPLCFRGFTAREAVAFVGEVDGRLAGLRLRGLAGAVEQALFHWQRPGGKDQYLTEPRHRDWLEAHAALCEELRDLIERATSTGVVPDRALELVALWDGRSRARTERNDAWVASQRTRHADLFAHGMPYPLHADQIDAILHDEHRSLVVAGAGTGKTSTIVAKVRWILDQGLASPDGIRILAFNRKAAREVSERLGTGALQDSIASTFHKLGLELVARARGKKPRLTKLADDERLLQAFLRSSLDTALMDPTVAPVVTTFLAFFRYPEANPTPIADSDGAFRFAEGHDIRSFTGVKLKSNSEAIIANWLTLNGIEWAYETKYELDTATLQYGQYHPDFFLPKDRIYIEHWSCDTDGNLPEAWSAAEQSRYREAMAWKRALHRRRGTRLVESFSRPYSQQTAIVRILGHKLDLLKVARRRLTIEDVHEIVSVDEIISPVVTLVERFLALYRESGASPSKIHARLESRRDARGKAFMDMFEWLHARYEAHLRDEGAVDFSDMIRGASAALREGEARLRLDYLLVDEFQDISRGRADLIQAILEQNAECRLVAVGDDWQSIYRFAGSDVQIMVDFDAQFGATRRCDLRQTHRFGHRLLEASSRFVQANPQQLRKALIASRRDVAPAIEVISIRSVSRSVQEALSRQGGDETASIAADRAEWSAYVDGGDRLQTAREATATALRDILRRIADERGTASVLVLGRYNFMERVLGDVGAIPKGVSVSFSTVHRAKGLEADFVVVLDVVTGRYGFPSEIEDDPIMSLVAPSAIEFPNAEERRLFYVAMTRAKSKAFVLTDDHNRSTFVRELEEEDYIGEVLPSDASARVVDCPECGGDTLVLRVSRYGPFYSCAHDRCFGKASRCPHCGHGSFVREETRHRCLLCDGVAQNCPNCERGYLKHIPAGVSRASGRAFAAFDACSTNQPEPAYRCFTRACRCGEGEAAALRGSD